MSSDNGIYIAEIPTLGGSIEYKVTYASCIGDIDLDFMSDGEEKLTLQDAYRAFVFGDAKSFSSKEEATQYAFKLEEEIGYAEYGVSNITLDRPLIEMSSEEALRIIEAA